MILWLCPKIISISSLSGHSDWPKNQLMIQISSFPTLDLRLHGYMYLKVKLSQRRAQPWKEVTLCPNPLTPWINCTWKPLDLLLRWSNRSWFGSLNSGLWDGGWEQDIYYEYPGDGYLRKEREGSRNCRGRTQAKCRPGDSSFWAQKLGWPSRIIRFERRWPGIYTLVLVTHWKCVIPRKSFYSKAIPEGADS